MAYVVWMSFTKVAESARSGWHKTVTLHWHESLAGAIKVLAACCFNRSSTFISRSAFYSSFRSKASNMSTSYLAAIMSVESEQISNPPPVYSEKTVRDASRREVGLPLILKCILYLLQSVRVYLWTPASQNRLQSPRTKRSPTLQSPLPATP